MTEIERIKYNIEHRSKIKLNAKECLVPSKTTRRRF